MEFKEVVGRRRSIRYFVSYRPVEREKIQTILEAARLASCAVNATFLRAIVVQRDDLAPEVLEGLKTPVSALNLELAPVHMYFYGDLRTLMDDMGIPGDATRTWWLTSKPPGCYKIRPLCRGDRRKSPHWHARSAYLSNDADASLRCLHAAYDRADLVGEPATADPTRTTSTAGAPPHPGSVLCLCWAIAGCDHRGLFPRYPRGKNDS
jgi:nitroreductase